MFSSACLFLGRLIYNQKKKRKKAFHLCSAAKGRKLLYADSLETKILKSGRGKTYVAALIGKPLKVVVKQMLKFITQRHEHFTVSIGATNSNINTLCYKY